MRKQRGVTMIGWIFLLTPMAIVLYAGIRLFPPYMNYYKVVMAMKETATQLKNDDILTAGQVKTPLERRFDVGYIDKPTIKDINVRKNSTGVWEMQADYEEMVPMFGNLFLLMQFQTAVPIQ